jgi:hypothetical protein
MMRTRREFIKVASTMCAAGLVAGKGVGAGPPSPSPKAARTTSHVVWRREIPVRYECDVAVVGGGIAGTSAALAAAQSGTRVILVEGFAVLGGNATVGGVGAFCGETAGQGEAFDAIIESLGSFNAIAPYRPYPDADHRVFDHEILAVVLQELLLRRGVKLLLHTRFADTCARGGRVRECVVCGPSGPEALRAKQFIDCTGEAQLVHQAGFETRKGRPGDGLQLPMSLMFFVRDVDPANARAQVPKGWFGAIHNNDDLPMTSVWPNGPRGNALKIKVPLFDASDTESLTAAEIHGRRRMMAVLDYFQGVEKKPWLLDHCAARIGIREGRRTIGDYILTVEDLRAGRAFDDAIARGVYYLDGHKPDDDKRTYILSPEERKVPPYQIPFRSLLPRGAKNLLAAGRCLSADQLALSSARVMTTCSMMGQAAGIAAALAAARGCDPRDLDYAEVRRIVCARGAKVDL